MSTAAQSEYFTKPERALSEFEMACERMPAAYGVGVPRIAAGPDQPAANKQR